MKPIYDPVRSGIWHIVGAEVLTLSSHEAWHHICTTIWDEVSVQSFVLVELLVEEQIKEFT